MGTKIKGIDTDLFTVLCLETDFLTLTRYLINIHGLVKKIVMQFEWFKTKWVLASDWYGKFWFITLPRCYGFSLSYCTEFIIYDFVLFNLNNKNISLYVAWKNDWRNTYLHVVCVLHMSFILYIIVVKVTQSCPTLHDSMDYTVCGIP